MHKLTNYKSNYTSTMYMKVIISWCNDDANQQEYKDDTMIFPKVHMLTNMLVP